MFEMPSGALGVPACQSVGIKKPSEDSKAAASKRAALSKGHALSTRRAGLWAPAPLLWPARAMSVDRLRFLLVAALANFPAAAGAASQTLRTQMGSFALAPAAAGISREVAAAPPLPAMLADAGAPSADANAPAGDAHVLPPPPGRALLHFAAGIDAADQAILATLGVAVHGHLPDDTLLVSLPDEGAQAQLAGLAQVAAVVPAPAWLALDAALLETRPAGIALMPFPGDGTRTLIVEATGPAAMPALAAEIGVLGGEVLEAAGRSRFVRVRMDAAATLGLAGSPRCLGDSKQETAREVPGPRCSAACSEVR